MNKKILCVTAVIISALYSNVQAEEQKINESQPDFGLETVVPNTEELAKKLDAAVVEKKREFPIVAPIVAVPAVDEVERVAQPAAPVQSAEEEKKTEKTAEPETKLQDKQDYEAEISYYIQNMNLSIEQLDKAKAISDDSRLKQEQMMQSIYVLRKQAYELEAHSLAAFEKILTPEQKVKFEELKALQNKERRIFDRLPEKVK